MPRVWPALDTVSKTRVMKAGQPAREAIYLVMVVVIGFDLPSFIHSGSRSRSRIVAYGASLVTSTGAGLLSGPESGSAETRGS